MPYKGVTPPVDGASYNDDVHRTNPSNIIFTTLICRILLRRIDIKNATPWSGALFMFVLNQTILTAAHAVTAIQTLVTGAASYGNVPAGIAGRCIALHAFGCCIYRIHTIGFYMRRTVLCFCRLCCTV